MFRKVFAQMVVSCVLKHRVVPWVGTVVSEEYASIFRTARNWDQMDSEVVRANRLLYTYFLHEIRLDVVGEDSNGVTFIPSLVKIEKWMQKFKWEAHTA
jgi:hypothetical protein